MKSVSVLIVGFSLAYATQCAAYELSTHALMTNRAYERSVLGSSSSTFLRLGIERWVMNPGSASSPFGASHHEIVDNNGNLVNRVADVTQFETTRIPDPLKGKYLQVTGWLMRGAIREDDFPTAKLGPITLITAVAPQDAPDSHVTRVSNHFFDPVNNRALDTTPFLNAQVVENNGFAAVKAVDWATGPLAI